MAVNEPTNFKESTHESRSCSPPIRHRRASPALAEPHRRRCRSDHRTGRLLLRDHDRDPAGISGGVGRAGGSPGFDRRRRRCDGQLHQDRASQAAGASGLCIDPCGPSPDRIGRRLATSAGGAAVVLVRQGLRGPLRDAIVIQAIHPEARERASGFHRAMYTIGAVVGPLLGVTLLGWAQDLHWADAAGPFRLVLWLSVIQGVLAVIAFMTLVQDPAHSPNPGLRLFNTLRGLPSRFKKYLAAVGVFGLGDFSHSLLILAATQLLTARLGIVHAAQVAGLLYVWRNVVQLLASYPVRARADRIGSLQVLVIGYALGALTALGAVAAFWWQVDSIPVLALVFLAAGLYMTVQEALESTVTADMVAQDKLATGYGALGTVNGIAS